VRTRIALLVVVLIAAVAGGGYAYYVNHRIDGPLTGQPVSRDVAGRRPVAVTIDNYLPDSSPQSGLSKASLVFETLAEGGITRFMAVFLENDAPTVGPVRSTRIYFNSWAAGLGVILGHDGGNVDALHELPTLTTVANIDADRVVGPFSRISSRQVPHNEYTSTQKLRQYAQSHGMANTPSRMTIAHKNDAPFSQRPASFTLNVAFSGLQYDVQWRYDRAANDYLRFMGGTPHVDATTGKQLTARNVVVMYTTLSPDPDPFTPGSITLGTEGTGKCTVYEDGTTVQGVWSKSTVDSPLQWLDTNGNPIKLNTGNTWVEVVPTGTSVTTSG
jgi:Protein of unknown function (DUF3048) N-terminal domain/Protein of unknown function (DUF3048) C-terminal domain